MANEQPQPFTLRVLDSEFEELRERLARTRFPDSAPSEPWAYGTDVGYLRGLVDYWGEAFDWRAQEARLNAFPQFKLTRPDCDLHFLHVPGKGPAPTPLLLMHGWPGSVFEFLDFIPRLTDPARFGADPADAFTVVAPSLPGFGLSFRPGQKRFGVEEIADCLAGLMTDTLGYKRFAVQGGDWGAITAARMGYAHADKLIGVHVNLLSVRRDPERIKNPTPEERVFLDQLNHWLSEETGYQWIQGTRPQTLSFALNRLSGRARGLDRGEIPRLVRLRRRRRERLHARPDARQHQLLLVHRRDRIVVLSLLLPPSSRLDDPGWRVRNGADRSTPNFRARSSSPRDRWRRKCSRTSAAGR